MHAVTLKKLEDLETTGERCARVCYVGSWPCLSYITFAKTLICDKELIEQTFIYETFKK